MTSVFAVPFQALNYIFPNKARTFPQEVDENVQPYPRCSSPRSSVHVKPNKVTQNPKRHPLSQVFTRDDVGLYQSHDIHAPLQAAYHSNTETTPFSTEPEPLELFTFSDTPQPLRTFDTYFKVPSKSSLFRPTSSLDIQGVEPIPFLDEIDIYLRRFGQAPLLVDVDPVEFRRRKCLDEREQCERSEDLFLFYMSKDSVLDDTVLELVEEAFVKRVKRGEPFQVLFEKLVNHFDFDEELSVQGGELWMYFKEICRERIQ